MMAQVNAGRVRFVGRGEYNNSTQYYVFDLVNYNGNSYYAKADTIGNLPTNTTYWQLVAEKGNVGPTGLTGNGISSIEKTSTSGLVDTYTITYTNGNTTTFDVSNGNGIDRIEKTATVGNIDTYTIYFNDNSTSTFEVANGEVTREELEEEVDRLSMIYNAFPSTTGEGEEPSINGTAEVPFKEIGLKGNTSQESTTGKNLLNNTLTSQTKNGITIVVNEDKSVTLNGTATEITWLILNSSITLPAGTYTMSQGNNNGTVRMFCGALDGYTSNGVRTTTISEQKTSDISINVPSGSTLTNLTFKPMVEVGSTATDYEPYTGNQPSPSPDYPQDVQVVTGDNSINVCGKNLFDKSKISTGYLKEDATLSTDAAYRTSDFMPIQPNTTYYKTSTGSPITKYFDINKVPLNTTTYWDVPTGGSAGTFTTPNNAYYLRFSFPFIGSSAIDIDTIMVKEGTDATYEAYKGASYPISLGDIELCKIGNYQDYFYKDSDKWYLHKEIGKVVLDGTENWIRSGNTSENFFCGALAGVSLPFEVKMGTASDSKSNYFIKGNKSSNAEVFDMYNGTQYYTTIALYLSTSKATDVTTFKNWLTTHNTILYYVLNTPTITEITDTTLIEQLDNLEKAYSYDTQTNITQTNDDMPFILDVEAILSLKNIFNS